MAYATSGVHILLSNAQQTNFALESLQPAVGDHHLPLQSAFLSFTTILCMCRAVHNTSFGTASIVPNTSCGAAPVRNAEKVSKAGATAAEAVSLSDDDDDVVIIEEGMQPQQGKNSSFRQSGMFCTA